MKHWYVVQCRSGQEDRAWEGISDQGFETYLPRFRVVRPARRGRKPSDLLKPLYPTYLFVQFEQGEQYGAILHTAGVATILGMHRRAKFPVDSVDEGWSGRPLAVRDSVIAELREWEAVNGCLVVLEVNAKLQTGQRVRIGVIQALVQADLGARVRVLLDMLGRSHSKLVPRDSVALR